MKILIFYLFMVLGGFVSFWSFYNWYLAGFKISGQRDIGQIDDGLFLLFLVIGLICFFYGLFGVWLEEE